VESKRGLVLDARPEIFHRLGHVPGALSLPRDDFETGYAALKEKLEADRSQPIVIYCSSASCEDSGLVKKTEGPAQEPCEEGCQSRRSLPPHSRRGDRHGSGRSQ
jgi:predicted sulfurtransferase